MGADGGVRQSFTGQMRDVETGLDFFGARFYSGALGRFTSADEVFADQDPGDPMSWNLMAYVRNNPLRYTDPTGRGCVAASNPQAGDAAKAGAILWSNSPVVPGPRCEEIDKADQTADPTATVTGRAGALAEYLFAAPVPRYVPNDTPLENRGRIVMQELSKRIDSYPAICATGVTVRVGRENSLAVQAPGRVTANCEDM